MSLVPVALKKAVQKWEVKGVPIRNLAAEPPGDVFEKCGTPFDGGVRGVRGDEVMSLVWQSTTVKMASYPLAVTGNWTIWSIEMEDQGWSGIRSGCRKPSRSRCDIVWRWQVLHVRT